MNRADLPTLQRNLQTVFLPPPPKANQGRSADQLKPIPELGKGKGIENQDDSDDEELDDDDDDDEDDDET